MLCLTLTEVQVMVRYAESHGSEGGAPGLFASFVPSCDPYVLATVNLTTEDVQ